MCRPHSNTGDAHDQSGILIQEVLDGFQKSVELAFRHGQGQVDHSAAREILAALQHLKMKQRRRSLIQILHIDNALAGC